MYEFNKGTPDKFWGRLSIFEIWLFCTVSNCSLEINDGKVVRATCHGRRKSHEN